MFNCTVMMCAEYTATERQELNECLLRARRKRRCGLTIGSEGLRDGGINILKLNHSDGYTARQLY